MRVIHEEHCAAVKVDCVDKGSARVASWFNVDSHNYALLAVFRLGHFAKQGSFLVSRAAGTILDIRSLRYDAFKGCNGIVRLE